MNPILRAAVSDFPSFLATVGHAIRGFGRRAPSVAGCLNDWLLVEDIPWVASMNWMSREADDHSVEIAEWGSKPTFGGGCPPPADCPPR